MEAVRNTEAVTFDYLAPTRGPEWYDLPDDPEQAEQVLQQRLTAAPLEAAARHQHGFIAEDARPPLPCRRGADQPRHQRRRPPGRAPQNLDAELRRSKEA